MEGKKLFRVIQLDNLLSYGTHTSLLLEPLNVLIGPNASGKSNLLDAFGLIHATTKEWSAYIREGGGVQEWLWKGGTAWGEAGFRVVVNNSEGSALLHFLFFTSVGQRPWISKEGIADFESVMRPYMESGSTEQVQVASFYGYDGENGVAHLYDSPINFTSLNPQQSILSQRKDPALYPEVTYLGEVFGSIKLYRDWNFGRYTKPRLPQPADLPEDFLLEDASNLGLVLNALKHKPTAWQQVLDKLQRFYPAIEDVSTKVFGGFVQVFVHEKGLAQPIPATRMSDGLLHYLCLLSILCHPAPPPFIALEEPEIGLHPDVMPELAQLLIEASQRTQIVVTTHSDALVSALSEVPECILVCERGEDGTELRRLEAEPLREWLEKYSLGGLWRMGEIGGVR